MNEWALFFLIYVIRNAVNDAGAQIAALRWYLWHKGYANE